MVRRLLGAAALAGVLALPLPAWGQSCMASFYGGGEKLNRHTANGDVFRASGLTAAHRSFRFGTKVRVTRGKRSVVVRINDRGPHRSTGRCIDLSRAAAAKLGMIRSGTARVRIQVIK